MYPLIYFLPGMLGISDFPLSVHLLSLYFLSLSVFYFLGVSAQNNNNDHAAMSVSRPSSNCRGGTEKLQLFKSKKKKKDIKTACSCQLCGLAANLVLPPFSRVMQNVNQIIWHATPYLLPMIVWSWYQYLQKTHAILTWDSLVPVFKKTVHPKIRSPFFSQPYAVPNLTYFLWNSKENISNFPFECEWGPEQHWTSLTFIVWTKAHFIKNVFYCVSLCFTLILSDLSL